MMLLENWGVSSMSGEAKSKNPFDLNNTDFDLDGHKINMEDFVEIECYESTDDEFYEDDIDVLEEDDSNLLNDYDSPSKLNLNIDEELKRMRSGKDFYDFSDYKLSELLDGMHAISCRMGANDHKIKILKDEQSVLSRLLDKDRAKICNMRKGETF